MLIYKIIHGGFHDHTGPSFHGKLNYNQSLNKRSLSRDNWLQNRKQLLSSSSEIKKKNA